MEEIGEMLKIFIINFLVRKRGYPNIIDSLFPYPLFISQIPFSYTNLCKVIIIIVHFYA
jgi:hypothetical protein